MRASCRNRRLIFLAGWMFITFSSLGQKSNMSPEITSAITKYLKTDQWKPYKYPELPDFKSVVKGDFLGNGTEDEAWMIELKFNDPDHRSVRLILIDKKDNGKITSVLEVFPEMGKGEGFAWAGVFEKVKQNSPLWENFVDGKGDDGWRELDEVPEEEIVRLNYDAFYLHASESCGGGFIFWKDEKWNWLQQE